jgi:hypothetical protein
MEIPDRGRMGCGHAWENDSLCCLVVRLTPGKPLQMQQLKRETLSSPLCCSTVLLFSGSHHSGNRSLWEPY